MVGEDAGKICRGWWKKLIDMHVLGPFLSELQKVGDQEGYIRGYKEGQQSISK